MKAFNLIKKQSFFFISFLMVMSCNNPDNKNSKTDGVDVDTYKPQTHLVTIKDMSFQPASLTVHKGDTVVWTNKDIVAHDVTAENKAWHSNSLLNDSSFKKVIEKSENYYCSIHIVMKGELKVAE